MNNTDLFGNEIIPLNPPRRKSEQKEGCTGEAQNGSTSDNSTRGKASGKAAGSWYKYQSGNFAKVSVYPKEICVSFVHAKSRTGKPPKRTANDIHNFSRKSRFRMLRVFNRTRTKQLSKPLFITCTARQAETTHEKFKYQFHKLFLPKLKDVLPATVYIWKMEPHQSGKAHYHMIVWTKALSINPAWRKYKRGIRAAWRDSIGDHSKAAQLYSCKIEELVSEEKAFKYLRKYMMKEEGMNTAHLTGRRWGRSKNYPSDPITECYISLDSYRVLKLLAKEALRREGQLSEGIEEAMDSEFGWFIWSTPGYIISILEFIDGQVSYHRFLRYCQTGSPYPWPEEELQYRQENGFLD